MSGREPIRLDAALMVALLVAGAYLLGGRRVCGLMMLAVAALMIWRAAPPSGGER